MKRGTRDYSLNKDIEKYIDFETSNFYYFMLLYYD